MRIAISYAAAAFFIFSSASILAFTIMVLIMAPRSISPSFMDACINASVLERIAAASSDDSYVLTTGTGSGKSLAYIVPIVNEAKMPFVGPWAAGTGITKNEKLIQQLSDNIHIDRLNIGPIPTTKLNWLQPHEGNIIDFLYRARAFQNSPPPAH